MRFRKCVVALLVLCLLAAIPALAEGLEIEEEPILPESEEIDFTDDSIVGEDIDNTVEEEDFMLSHDEPMDEGYADFLTEGDANPTEVPIDAEHFPDNIFRDHVYYYFDTNEDYVLSGEEIQLVKTLDMSYQSIKSLKGIEYLTNLEYLDCSWTPLTSLGVNMNIALTEIYCERSDLKSLNASGCTALKKINCNECQLTSINVSGCTALEEFLCEFNQMTNLDVSECTALKKLNCSGCGLTSLDVSGCTALEDLDCSYTQLTSLYIDRTPALVSVDCNATNLTALDLSNRTALTYLTCRDAQFTSLDVSGCTALERLDCFSDQLTNVDVRGCTALVEFGCYDNQLTSLDLSDCAKLKGLYCSDNQLTSLDLSNCTKLKELYCSDNQLTSLDVQKNKKLVDLICSTNKLKSLNLSKNTALEYLNCSDNQLASLSISKNTALGYLCCYDNQLTSLDISQNTKLSTLECQHNSIPEIDISKCPYLKDPLLDNPIIMLLEDDKSVVYAVTPVGEDDSMSTDLPKHNRWFGDDYYGWLGIDRATKMLAKGRTIITLSDISLKNQTYTGKALKPAPTVKVNGKKLKKGTDYKVSYKDNTEIGTATIIIKGKGTYVGTKILNFKIKPKGTNLSKLTGGKKKITVKWNKQTKQVGGYQIQYGTKKDFSNAKKVTVSGAKTAKTTIKKLKANKIYYVRIRTYKTVSGKKYYSSWSKYKKIKTK